MKYVLVDKLDNINTSVELEERIGLHGATIYFQSMKKMHSFPKLNGCALH